MAQVNDDENTALFHEIRAMMAEGDEDEDRKPLSSDEEGFVDGLMQGHTARQPLARRSGEQHVPPAVRKESAAVSAGAGFNARLFAAFDSLQPGRTGAAPSLEGGWHVGPAFSEQCRGHGLAEPLDSAGMGQLSDSAEEEDDALHEGGKRGGAGSSSADGGAQRAGSAGGSKRRRDDAQRQNGGRGAAAASEEGESDGDDGGDGGDGSDSSDGGGDSRSDG